MTEVGPFRLGNSACGLSINEFFLQKNEKKHVKSFPPRDLANSTTRANIAASRREMSPEPQPSQASSAARSRVDRPPTQ